LKEDGYKALEFAYLDGVIAPFGYRIKFIQEQHTLSIFGVVEHIAKIVPGAAKELLINVPPARMKPASSAATATATSAINV
jgi:hypothetical protein